MNRIKLNEKILQGIKEKSGGDDVIEKFLIDLIYEEASHSGIWRWKDIYKQKIEKSSNEWGGTHEN